MYYVYTERSKTDFKVAAIQKSNLTVTEALLELDSIVSEASPLRVAGLTMPELKEFTGDAILVAHVGDIECCLLEMTEVSFEYSLETDHVMTYSHIAHRNQKRKYTGVPYAVHPATVATLLTSHGVTDRNAIKAAFLHDVVEDTSIEIEEIYACFGDEVGLLVKELTDIETKGPRVERNRHKNRRLAKASSLGKSIKCADIIDNLGSIVVYDHKFGMKMIAETRDLIVSLAGADDSLYHSLIKACNGAAKYIDVTCKSFTWERTVIRTDARGMFAVCKSDKTPLHLQIRPVVDTLVDNDAKSKFGTAIDPESAIYFKDDVLYIDSTPRLDLGCEFV